MKVEYRPTETLIPYARNSRTHSTEQVAQIAASILEFGWTNPVLVDGDNGIIAGHGRVMAARVLGVDSVPVIELAHLTEAQKRAYIIADNKLAMNAGWDNELLATELVELGDMNFDLSLTGFCQIEIDGLMGEDVAPGEMPALKDGDREPFQQMTFTLHDSQAEVVTESLGIAKGLAPFLDSLNENSNGNALARICETFLTVSANNG